MYGTMRCRELAQRLRLAAYIAFFCIARLNFILSNSP